MQKFDTPGPITAVLDIPGGRDVKVAKQTTVEYGDGVLRIESSAKNQVLGPSGTSGSAA
jgi:hypothetical protein